MTSNRQLWWDNHTEQHTFWNLSLQEWCWDNLWFVSVRSVECHLLCFWHVVSLDTIAVAAEPKLIGITFAAAASPPHPQHLSRCLWQSLMMGNRRPLCWWTSRKSPRQRKWHSVEMRWVVAITHSFVLLDDFHYTRIICIKSQQAYSYKKM